MPDRVSHSAVATTAPATPVPSAPAPEIAHPLSAPPAHGGFTRGRFVTMNILGAVFPLSAGVMFYGWRALGMVALLGLSALGASFFWRRVGRRGAQLRYDHALWLSLLLALSLPAHLFSFRATQSTPFALWPVAVAGGIALVVIIWVLGGPGSGRIHPVLITHLLLFVLFGDHLVARNILRPQHTFFGDVLDASVEDPSARRVDPWVSRRDDSERPAVRTAPASTRLESFTNRLVAPERGWISLESLVRDRMPPLEDLIVGGQPGPVGASSAIAVIIGGLFLLYRGLIDYRIPLIIVVSALLCLILLPVPVVITESPDTSRLHWFVAREPGVGWALAVTFANYELMAAPLLFTAFFLATSASLRPMTRRARTIYAALVGAASAGFQLYASVMIGPYLALLAASLLAPALDWVFRPRTLV